MIVLHDSVLTRDAQGDAVRHFRDGARRSYRRVGHRVVAIDGASDCVVTATGDSLWIWQHGLEADGLEVNGVVERLPRLNPPHARSLLENIAATASRAEVVDRAVNVGPQKPYASRAQKPSPFGPLPTVAFGLDGRSLVVIQLGHFDESHDDEPRYRSIACTPPWDSSIREERLLAWCAHNRGNFGAVVELPDGATALGEPGAVEIAFDANPPSRAVLPDVVASEVQSAHLVRPDGTNGWRAVLAFRHYIATFELRRGAITTRGVSACGGGEVRMGADASARPLIRIGDDVVRLAADGSRTAVAARIAARAAVSDDGRWLVHRTGTDEFTWVDLTR